MLVFSTPLLKAFLSEFKDRRALAFISDDDGDDDLWEVNHAGPFCIRI